MHLHHFTSTERLLLIQADGFLKVTESDIGSAVPRWEPFGEHVGPDVVFLTDDPLATGEALAVTPTLDGTDKTAVRITVDVPDEEVWWWPDFASHHGINPHWRCAIEKGHDPEAWWLVARPILMHEFVETHVRPEAAHLLTTAICGA